MKTLLAALFIAGATMTYMPPATAQSASARAAASSPLLGRWSLDVSRLGTPPQARPKSVTIAFSDAGNGKWAMRVDIVGADGSLRSTTGTCALDGTPAQAQGDTTEASASAMKLPAPHTLVLGLSKGGVPASTRVYTVSADGKSMTETASYFGSDNLPVLKTSYFTRAR